MSDLRLTGKSEDGTHLSLVDNDGHEFSLRISDTLRATINQPRLSAVDVREDVESISVKEIQRRLRAGESAESIARDGRTSVDKVERWAGPILSERVYIINQAHDLSLRKENNREPFTFFDIVVSKLSPRGVDIDDLIWRTWRNDDGTWIIELNYPNNAGHGVAQWVFDPSRRSIVPEDDNASWMIGEEPAPRKTEPGLVYSDAPAPIRISSLPPAVASTPKLAPVESFDDIEDEADEVEEVQEVEETPRETPRLVALREEPRPEDTKDGIKGRAKVPSWDEIMFGMKPAAPAQNESGSDDDKLFP